MTPYEIANFQRLFLRFIEEELEDETLMRKIALFLLTGFIIWMEE